MLGEIAPRIEPEGGNLGIESAEHRTPLLDDIQPNERCFNQNRISGNERTDAMDKAMPIDNRWNTKKNTTLCRRGVKLNRR